MTIRNRRRLLFFTRATEVTKKNTKTTTLCCCFVFEKSENKEEEAKTTTICVIVTIFYFSWMTNEKKKHENDDCALSSLCLRGAKTIGKDDDNLCDCCHLLVFKGTITRRKKRTQKKTRNPHVGALANSYFKKPWKLWKNKTLVLFLPLNLALNLHSLSVAKLNTPQLERSTTRVLHITP